MKTSGVDVLVVGARCAGAPLAIHLARAGARVVAIDRDDFPSDHSMSTHFIQLHGVELLEELGLGDDLRKIATPIPLIVGGTDEERVWLDLAKTTPAFCPRRTDLDALLVETARAAGADVRTRTKLVELVKDGERVTGAIVEHEGAREQIRASVVVGADGWNSSVAKLAGAKTYKEYESPRAGYWSYWPRPSWYDSDERYRGAGFNVHRGSAYRLAFPTARDQMLIGIIFPTTELGEWRGRHRETFLARVREDNLLGPIVEDREPIDQIRGLVTARFFFREAAGPGWALVGDAGLFKDPAPGFGITDALRDAKALASAIEAGTDEALVAYWRVRDARSLELFHFAEDMGATTYNNPLTRVINRHLGASSELQQRILDINLRRRAPSAAFKTSEIVRWTMGALLRGRFGVWAPFLAAGKRGGEIAKELAAWSALADEAKLAASQAERRYSFGGAERAA
jgi:flavin-dependent dehydrogenase